MKLNRAFGVALVWMVSLPLAVIVSADTLVMRDGRRVEGQLLAVRNGVIEFEGHTGGFFGHLERMRIDRDEVRRIEFDEDEDEDSSDGRDRARGDRASDGPSRPSGLRERDVRVSSDIEWNDGGLDVRDGQTVYFSARNEIDWARGHRDGPGGDLSSRYGQRPMPSRPVGALIGKIGRDSQDYFFVGANQGAFLIRGSGRLFLGVNDDNVRDNVGYFMVTVYY